MKPIEWTDGLINRICDEIASGKSIRSIAARPWAPSEPSIYRRMASDGGFAAKMAIARAAQQDYEADACVEMADKATAENYQVVKLRIWARQWRASKLAPKKYGDRVIQEIGGIDGGPIKTESIVNVEAGEAYLRMLNGNS